MEDKKENEIDQLRRECANLLEKLEDPVWELEELPELHAIGESCWSAGPGMFNDEPDAKFASFARSAIPVFVKEIERANLEISRLLIAAKTSEILDEIRNSGWSVAVHNDYSQDGEFRTFWLFTGCGNMSAKGEGKSDYEALQIAQQIIYKINDRIGGY